MIVREETHREVLVAWMAKRQIKEKYILGVS